MRANPRGRRANRTATSSNGHHYLFLSAQWQLVGLAILVADLRAFRLLLPAVNPVFDICPNANPAKVKWVSAPSDSDMRGRAVDNCLGGALARMTLQRGLPPLASAPRRAGEAWRVFF
jgi:hypothetical protein